MEKLNSQEVTLLASVLAVELSCGKSLEEITDIKLFLNQVVNTLTTIILQQINDKMQNKDKDK